MLKQDYHIHSELSPDSTASLDGICKQAFRLGLEEVALTDHYELIEGVTPRGSIRKEYLALTREKILDCRSRWEGRIRVVFGIELGQIHRQPEAAAQILAANPYDFVLASLHRVEHTDLSLFNYQAIDGKALRRTYGEELLEIAEKGDYDCLSHLDLIRRYPAFQGVTLRMEEDMEIVEEILRQVVQRGKGIEINTTAGTLAEPLPSLEILKTYRRLGGEIVTTGSDAHRAEDVAKGFANAEPLLREAGFRCTARYKERKPRFVEIK